MDACGSCIANVTDAEVWGKFTTITIKGQN